jgi:hypothetical protein
MLPIVVRAARAPAPEVRTDLVWIDVVVADTAGQPVRGLAREDFEGTEDGRPQRIAQFLVADAAAAPSALAGGAASPAAPVPAPDPTERGQGSGRRTV